PTSGSPAAPGPRPPSRSGSRRRTGRGPWRDAGRTPRTASARRLGPVRRIDLLEDGIVTGRARYGERLRDTKDQPDRDAGKEDERDRQPGKPSIIEDPDAADDEGRLVPDRVPGGDGDRGRPRGQVDARREPALLVDGHDLPGDFDGRVGRRTTGRTTRVEPSVVS